MSFFYSSLHSVSPRNEVIQIGQIQNMKESRWNRLCGSISYRVLHLTSRDLTNMSLCELQKIIFCERRYNPHPGRLNIKNLA